MPVTEQKNIYVPAFKITANNKTPLDPLKAKSVIEVSLTEYSKPPGRFTILANDPKLELIDPQNGLFREGTLIEIHMGYVGDMRKMMAGEISSITADFPNSGAATVHVEGFDLMHRLTRGTAYRVFGGSEPDRALSDRDIVTQIAEDVGLTPSFEQSPEGDKQEEPDNKERTLPRVQNNITNLAFLEELARKNSYYLWVEGNTLYFMRKRPAPKTIRLEWGKNLLSLSLRLSTAGLVKEVEVRGWDPVQKQDISAREPASGEASMLNLLADTGQKQIAKGSGGRSKLVITDTQAASEAEARSFAKTILSEQWQTVITGTGSSFGQPDIRVGTLLELSNTGRFNGTYEVEQVTHTIGLSGYTTSFQIYNKRS